MAAVTTFDALLARISNEYDETFVWWGDATSKNTTANTGVNIYRFGDVKAVPGSLPTGVTAYIPTEISTLVSGSATTGMILFAEQIDLGHLDISGASGTFTDGSAMPTRTELGSSIQIASPILAEVTTALNATPGTYTVTYTNQSGTGSRVTSATTPTNSAALRSAGFLTLSTTTTNDTGCVDITAAARAAGTTPTGVIKFWGLIPIALTPFSANFHFDEDLINSGLIRRLPASASIGIFFVSSASTATSGMGHIRMVGDS